MTCTLEEESRLMEDGEAGERRVCYRAYKEQEEKASAFTPKIAPIPLIQVDFSSFHTVATAISIMLNT